MNLERISFRTTKEEQAFLESLNQSYRCRTATSLMHSLFKDIMKGSLAVPDGVDQKFSNATGRTENPISQRKEYDTKKDRIIMQDTTIPSTADNSQALMAQGNHDSYPHSRANPYLEILREIEDFEEFKRHVNRSLYRNDTK